MKTINIQAAKTHLSRLVEQAVAGEEIVLAKAGRPLVKLVPVVPEKEPRILGALRGQMSESPDCWQPDEELEDAFYNSPLTLAEQSAPGYKAPQKPKNGQ